MSIVYIASDHAGFHLKDFLAEYLVGKGHEVHDLGPASDAGCDYPDSARLVTDALLQREDALGILICGTGIGMSMAANRVHGIRAALATCEFHARACRAHNNANILCLGERVTGQGLAADLADIFLSTPFEGGRHLRRVQKFD
ncbi:MAG TPA: ribose 5-phosphate isomerase B [Candidatus Mailhella merdigallinarum]|uniref:Ribose 5-phosphate isomerase B n=1 Tax=Candidatus Mailhella merdigallinarum TaxID=2838658 RepID=A0A9D2KKI9_9BACT|nr:ribose 5-phosphate isomerase B [Candidatus Mailhella merdigallinarum]